jgi:hypothetical protein
MAQTKYAGKDLYFAIDDTAGALQQVTGVTSVTGLPGEVEHYDATAVGDSGRKHIAGLENVTVIVEGWYDDTATTGSKVLFSALAAQRSADLESGISFGPKGNSSGFEKMTAETKLKTIEYPAAMGDLVKFRAELLVQGVVTIGSYT